MNGWSPERRLEYFVLLGIKNRRAEYTRDFGGEAAPEADSVAAIPMAAAASRPLVKLLYVLSKHGDDICLDAPTARSITGTPVIGGLIEVLNKAVESKLVKRTATQKPLAESDRDSMVGLRLTENGMAFVNNMLHDALPTAAG